MKKLLLIAGLALLASVAFAQNAPANEIYGQVWLDYDLSGAQVGNLAGLPSAVGSNFNFSRVRFGLRNTLADNVKTWFEFDPRNLEFRQVNADWSPMAGLDIIAGKQSKLFAQQNDWVFGDRTLGLQARYAMPGLGWAGIIVGNDATITNVSSKKIQWPAGPTASNITETFANPSFVMIYPQVTVKPDLGTDMSFEAGVNAEINATKLGWTSPTGSSLDAYALFSGYGASVAVEYTFKNFNDTNSANQDHVLYTRVGYNLGFATPTAYVVVDNLLGNNTGATGSFTNNSTPNATVMLEVPFNATKDLVIDPFFSYAVSGYNLLTYYVQGYSAGQISVWPTSDWAAGLRIKYSLSGKF